jgi:phosphohistidine phosphatase
MEVWLVRHAVAHERDLKRWPNDALRPLTPAGKRKFRKSAHGLASCLPKSVVLLTSPYVRARETAAILVRELPRAKVIEADELAAGRPVNYAFDLLRARKEKIVVLVGHEPNMSALLSAALAGERARLKIEFKKGGAACLEFTQRPEPGEATLRCMLPPRVLRASG